MCVRRCRATLADGLPPAFAPARYRRTIPRSRRDREASRGSSRVRLSSNAPPRARRPRLPGGVRVCFGKRRSPAARDGVEVLARSPGSRVRATALRGFPRAVHALQRLLLATLAGLEPAACSLGGSCSIQLSYRAFQHGSVVAPYSLLRCPRPYFKGKIAPCPALYEGGCSSGRATEARDGFARWAAPPSIRQSARPRSAVRAPRTRHG